MTFQKGTGDTPDDFYLLYLEPGSGRLKLASYIVTFPALRKGKPIEDQEQHAIVFQGWQTVDGLEVPRVARFYPWNGETIEGGSFRDSGVFHVRFSAEAADKSLFNKPADAVIAPLE